MAKSPTIKKLPICDISIFGDTQAREAIDQPTVDEYAYAIEAGATLPPVVVFWDGKTYWLADGFHRRWAAVKIDLGELDAEIHEGTRRDALLYACGANASHGLKRTNDDKRRAVMLMLNDEEWAKWSDNAIGKHCAVDNKTVAKHRANLGIPKLDERKSADGKTRNTANIGRKVAREPEPDSPGWDEPEEFAGFGDPAPSLGADDAAFPEGNGQPPTDVNGVEIPEDMHKAVFGESDYLTALQNRIQQLRRDIKEICAAPVGAYLHGQSVDSHLKSCWSAIKFAVPYAVCPEHSGAKCKPCKGTGWMPKDIYELHTAAMKKAKK